MNRAIIGHDPGQIDAAKVAIWVRNAAGEQIIVVYDEFEGTCMVEHDLEPEPIFSDSPPNLRGWRRSSDDTKLTIQGRGKAYVVTGPHDPRLEAGDG